MVTPPAARFTSVRFGVLTDTIAQRVSKLEIQNPNIEKNNEGGGLYDLSLGTLSSHKQCQTCKYEKSRCAGHSGTLQVRHPYILPIYTDIVKKIIKHVCFNCKRFYPTIPQNRKCEDCGKDQLIQVSKVTEMGFYINTAKDKKVLLDASLLPKFLLNITLEDAKTHFGLSVPPAELISRVLFINSIVIRPDKKVQQGAGSKEEFTANLQTLVGACISMRAIDNNHPNFQQQYERMNNLLINYHKGKTTDDTNTMKKSIASALASKEGRIRQNLLGKKVYHIGRSVIVCDSTNSPEIITIPMAFAMNLFVRETVQEYNRERLESAFANGPSIYPGASYVFKGGDKNQKYAIGNVSVQLDIGDTILRHLVDGDYVLFSRQPILVAESICGQRVKVSRDPEVNSISMNVVTCALFNADFDGKLNKF